jgi:hypothetical protein
MFFSQGLVTLLSTAVLAQEENVPLWHGVIFILVGAAVGAVLKK